jgi:hypothetical protein
MKQSKFTFSEDDQGGDVLGLASSQSGDSTGAVLSHYIDKVFSGAHAHTLLINYLRALLQWSITDEAKGLKTAAGKQPVARRERKKVSSFLLPSIPYNPIIIS